MTDYRAMNVTDMNLIPINHRDTAQQGDRCLLLSTMTWYVLGSDGRTWETESVTIMAHLCATGGNGSATNPWTGWASRIPWADHIVVEFCAGWFDATDLPDLGTFYGTTLRGSGDSTVLIKASGSVVKYSNSALPHYSLFIRLENFVVDGKGTAAIGFDLTGISYSPLIGLRARNCTDVGFRIRRAISNSLTNCMVANTLLDSLVTVVPAIGIQLDSDGLAPCNCNTLVSSEAFGCSNIGLDINAGFGNVVLGGAFEAGGAGSGAYGLHIAGSMTTIIGTDFEAVDYASIEGNQNQIINSWSDSTKLLLSGNDNVIEGGVWSAVLDTGHRNRYDLSIFTHPTTAYDRDSTASNRYTYHCSEITTSATPCSFPVNGDVMLRLPKNCYARLTGTMTAYCKSGVHAGDGYQWTLDYKYKSIGGALSLISNDSTGTGPNSWACAITIYGDGSGALSLAVTGSTNDTIAWEAALNVDINGGGPAIADPNAAINILVAALGGHRYRATDASITDGVMTVVDSQGTANLTSRVGAVPSIGTLSDGVTKAIVSTADAQSLHPASGALGTTATSHTVIAIGEPSNVGTNTFAQIFWGGSGGGAPQPLGFLNKYNSATNAAIFIQSEIHTFADSVATGLQVLEFFVDDPNDLCGLYRNGTGVAQAATTKSVPLEADQNFLGATDFTEAVRGAFVEFIYIPATLTVGQRVELQALFKRIYPNLP